MALSGLPLPAFISGCLRLTLRKYSDLLSCSIGFCVGIPRESKTYGVAIFTS